MRKIERIKHLEERLADAERKLESGDLIFKRIWDRLHAWEQGGSPSERNLEMRPSALGQDQQFPPHILSGIHTVFCRCAACERRVQNPKGGLGSACA